MRDAVANPAQRQEVRRAGAGQTDPPPGRLDQRRSTETGEDGLGNGQGASSQRRRLRCVGTCGGPSRMAAAMAATAGITRPPSVATTVSQKGCGGGAVTSASVLPADVRLSS